MMKLVVLAIALGCASAACPNDCSGNGVCGLSTQCECYRNWFGADCSLRICTFGRAFVDSPVGDLNGDGELNPSRSFDPSTNSWVEGISWVSGGTSELFDWQYGYARDARGDEWDEAHFYRECSNKGLCDRETGQCDCFPGYGGEGCTRTDCPNDCSGHGLCRTISDSDSDYSAWDSDKTQVCECDAGYGGPDCSLRDCPRGADPVEYAQVVTNSIQGIYWSNPTATSSTSDNRDALAQLPTTVYYTVAFTDEYGDDWTTSLLSIAYSTSCSGSDCTATVDFSGHNLQSQVDALNNSLVALPNNFDSTYVWGIDSATESASADSGTFPSSVNSDPDGSVWVDSLDYRLDSNIVDADCTSGTGYGACFYVKVNNPGKQSALTVKYYYHAEGADASSNSLQLASISGSSTGFASGAASDARLDLVTVWDVQASRVWNDDDGDVVYAFIGDSVTGLDVCSKRGTCDYDTGLCDCFSGYSGLRCDDQNAIAYSY